jgi:hypothetical protein
MSKTLSDVLQKAIATVVHHHSGGVKLLELICEVADLLNHDDEFVVEIEKFLVSVVDLPELVENEVGHMPNYHVLEYEWDMGDDTSRIKQFVYYKQTQSGDMSRELVMDAKLQACDDPSAWPWSYEGDNHDT